MKKLVSVILALCLCAMMMVTGFSEADNELMDRLNGTYISLFPEYAREEYRDYWMECIGAHGVTGEAADAVYTAMTQGYMSTLKGREAADAYSADPASMAFDCYLENGLQKIIIDGSMISGVDSENNEVFRHAYQYAEDVDVTFLGQPTGTRMHLYVTDDADAGMFTYFAFTDDTIAEECHIEFRYGETTDNIGDFSEGQYAFWLVGAINEDYEDSQIRGGIKLFVDENLGEQETAAQNILAGAGTQKDPYVITNTEELIAFAASVNSGETFGYNGQFIRLDADIDLSDVAWNPIGNMNDTENYSSMFMGTFDGNGHTISNLNFESNGPLIGSGLFGVSAGSIQNLNMRDCSVTATGLIAEDDQADGIIVGYNLSGTVNHCSVSNSRVSGLNCVGIIAGGSGGIVTDCTVTDCEVIVLGDNNFSDGLKQCDVAECGGLVVGGAFGGTVSKCTASGTITAEGTEPVGLGGIAGCLEMMNEVTGNKVNVTITTKQGGHAIGGLCGYAGTHSDSARILAETGVEVTNYPSLIHDCTVEAILNVPGATHVGGMIGTNLYFFGEETIWSVVDCSVKAKINGAITPGGLAGRAENSTFENCKMDVLIDGVAAENSIGATDCMYESLDQ